MWAAGRALEEFTFAFQCCAVVISKAFLAWYCKSLRQSTFRRITGLKLQCAVRPHCQLWLLLQVQCCLSRGFCSRAISCCCVAPVVRFAAFTGAPARSMVSKQASRNKTADSKRMKRECLLKESRPHACFSRRSSVQIRRRCLPATPTSPRLTNSPTPTQTPRTERTRAKQDLTGPSCSLIISFGAQAFNTSGWPCAAADLEPLNCLFLKISITSSHP